MSADTGLRTAYTGQGVILLLESRDMATWKLSKLVASGALFLYVALVQQKLLLLPESFYFCFERRYLGVVIQALVLRGLISRSLRIAAILRTGTLGLRKTIYPNQKPEDDPCHKSILDHGINLPLHERIVVLNQREQVLIH